MPINAVGAAGITPPSLQPTATRPTGPDAAGTTNFADQVKGALESVEQAQQTADGLAQQAATGELTDVHDYMIAATQAQLATDLTVAVRNRALESFQEIMRMQI